MKTPRGSGSAGATGGGHPGPPRRARPLRPSPRAWAGPLAALACWWAGGAAAEGAAFATTVAPTGANVVLQQPSVVGLRWAVAIVGAPGSTVALSPQGCFTTLPTTCPPPAAIPDLGRVNVPLTGTLVTGTGTSTAPESLLIPQTASLRAQQLGINTFFYNRTFTVSTIAGAASAALTAHLGSSAYGNFSIARVEIYFAEGRRDITVRRGTQGLKAYADIRFNGTGTLRGRWLVAEPGVRGTLADLDVGGLVGVPQNRVGTPDGIVTTRPRLDDWRILSHVERTIRYGDRIVLESPDVPGLPTSNTGTHLVRLEIFQERIFAGGFVTDAPVGIQLPVARYYVEGEAPGGLVARAGTAVRLAAPEDGAILPVTPPTFSWLTVPGAAQYRVEIFEADPRAGVVGGISGDPSVELYRSGPGALRAVTLMDAVGPRIFSGVTRRAVTSFSLHSRYLGRFRPGQVYLWKVVAVDDRGDAIGTSPLRVFSFRTP